MIWAVIGLLVGGILKGATGGGVPVVAVPILAVQFGVPVAVTILSLPNAASNIVQAWQYRSHYLPGAFAWAFALAGGLGVVVGTVALVRFDPDVLLATVAATTLAYVIFRLLRPDWVLGGRLARLLAVPIGLAGGTLQGAAGISAPISMTYLNAMGLDRRTFIATISLYFMVMGLVQAPALVGAGVMTWELAPWSVAALLPILAGMPIGAWLARRFSQAVFDRVMLALLTAISVKLLVDLAG